MPLRLKQESHTKLMELVLAIQKRHSENTEFRDKLEAIDTDYATQKHTVQDPNDCNVTIDGIKVPMVGSEVDTVVAQLAELFVARSPLFPVLATKDNWNEALNLQAIIDRDARYQGWGRQLLLFLHRAVRYNVAALAAEQTLVRTPEITNNKDISNPTPEVKFSSHTFTTLKAPCMYNTIFDPRVDPADISTRGEYVGYNELITRAELKTLGNLLSGKDLAYNLSKAYRSQLPDIDTYYFYPPEVSDYIISREADNPSKTNWLAWLSIVDPEHNKTQLKQDMYFKTVLYIRLIPSEMGLGSSNSPEIWKLTIINNQFVISFQSITTPFDTLPVLFADLREDGLGWQTKSVAEQVQPYENIATELLNVRLNGSRRAISDRAIYDSDYLSPDQVNSIVPAAKIPLKKNLRNLGADLVRMQEVYYPIPFEGQGVINAGTDLQTIMQIKDQVNGQNFLTRGQRQQGNRSALEANQIVDAGESKTIPYAVRLENQVFIPLKLLIKTYVLLTPDTSNLATRISDPYSESERDVDYADMRKRLLDYRLTDGLYTKTTIQDPDVMSVAMQVVSQNPLLAQTHDVSRILADFLHMFNIDINKYRLEAPNGNQPAQPAQPPTESPNPEPTQARPGSSEPSGG